jgi:long-chain fatty acid transport protein
VALANGYDVPNTNPRDLALVGSAIAGQVDAGAVYANPAALARLEGFSLTVGLTLLDNASTWKADGANTSAEQAGSPVSTDFHPAFPPSLFLSYGDEAFGHRWGAGLGFNVPAGGNVLWPSGWPGRFRIVNVDRKVYAFYLTGGVELVKQVRIGGGLVYYRTTEYLKQAADFLGSEGTAELSTAGGQASYDLSAEVTPLEDVPLTLAIDYKHQAVQGLSGDAHFSNVPDALRASLQDQTATHVLTYPNVLNLGVAWRPTPPLQLTFGYTFNRYVVYGEEVFAGSQGLTIAVPRHYRNGWSFRLGGEYQLTPEVQLRVGLGRDVSGVNTAFYSAALPDASSWDFAVGAGWAVWNRLAIQAAIFYAHFDQARVTGNTELQGVYDTRAWIFSTGVTWRFDRWW